MTTDFEAGPEDLADLLAQLARFSAAGAGVTRLVYDDAWCDAQRWLAARAAALGLEATADAAGNLFVHDPAVRPGALDRPVLLVGSHLDTVTNGGRYDGAYGVVAGLLLAAERRGSAGLPVVGFVTCEEEGSRFSAAMMGARALLGLVGRAELESVVDRFGVTWRAALEYARSRGCAAPLVAGDPAIPPLFRPGRTLELHIEQGPVLESAAEKLGIVDHIAGYRRLRAVLAGAARHAGTTPMDLRRDALAAAAEITVAIEALARRWGAPAVATVGALRAAPGAYNVVAGECEMWIEARHTDTKALAALGAELKRDAYAIAAKRRVEIRFEDAAHQDPVPLAEPLAREAEALARELGIPHRRMPSGAGHDTMVIAGAGIPALMVFVPSRGGISHSPEEHTAPSELWTGYAFLRALALRLAGTGA